MVIKRSRTHVCRFLPLAVVCLRHLIARTFPPARTCVFRTPLVALICRRFPEMQHRYRAVGLAEFRTTVLANRGSSPQLPTLVLDCMPLAFGVNSFSEIDGIFFCGGSVGGSPRCSHLYAGRHRDRRPFPAADHKADASPDGVYAFGKTLALYGRRSR